MIVLDSTVIIDLLRGHGPAATFLAGLTEVPACSEVTRVEVVRGLRRDEQASIEDLLRSLRWIALDEQIARRAGELGRRWRRSHGGIGLADLVVAATAQELGAALATSNIRHFPMFEGLAAPYPA